MQLVIDEEQQEHLYGCLLAGNSEWKGVQKKLAKLNREDDSVERALSVNAGLRKLLNPKAAEEALEAERKKSDPTQLSIEDQPASSGETGGGHPPGEVVKLSLMGKGPEDPPTNEALRDLLLEVDCLILLSDIRGFSNEERTTVVDYAHKVIDFMNSPADDTDAPALPDFLEAIALTKERAEQLNRDGSYKIVENAPGDEEPTEFKVVGDPSEELVFVDPVEAEIKCARLNRQAIKSADMPADLVQKWLAAGPWSVEAEQRDRIDYWFVVFDGQKEGADTQADAEATAARYNRSVAGRDEEGNWREPPVRLAEDAVQEIKAAAESTE